MKRFKLITSSIIIAAGLLLMADCYYMLRLYDAISLSIDRDIRASLAELDVDELWYRANHQNEYLRIESVAMPHGQIEGTLDDRRTFITRTITEDGDTVLMSKRDMSEEYSFTNRIIGDMSMQMHFRMDPYLPIKIEPLDSLFTARLSLRGIHPDFVAVELASSSDSIIRANPKIVAENTDDCNRYELQFNSYTGDKYIAYISSLTDMVFERMWGVVLFTLALIILFIFGFIYMWHFINKRRNLEEMKDSFVNSMTHELKTPISVAFSAADYLQRYYDTNSKEHNKEYLDIILRELSKHSAMVENILSMSMEKRNNMSLESVDVAVKPIIEEICHNQNLKATKYINFSIDIRPENLSLKTDPLHFTNIVNNIIENAIKYSGETVDISIRGDKTSIRITDNGIGIHSKHLPFIFDRFYRVPIGGNRYEVSGYGIGLYYVKHICGKMDWDISAESIYGKGSTFTIRFNSYAK